MLFDSHLRIRSLATFRSRGTFIGLAIMASVSVAGAADWITAPSYFTHDPHTAQRVSQFSPIGPFYVCTPPNYMKSGYRHYRSTIQAGGSADNLHIVEEWGRPVVPYEQWRFPFRPYGSPYQDWGPPFAGSAPNVIGGGWGGSWGGGWGGGGGQLPPNFPYYHPNTPAPWIDGYWPSYDINDRSRYYEPYRSRRDRW